MTILHRYVLGLLGRNFLLGLGAFTLLFLVIDFFDRIDNIVAADGSLTQTFVYFLYKTPVFVSLLIPVAMLVSTMLTFGLLSKNSEITAIRAAGVSLSWIARPLVWFGLAVSLAALLLNETLVPYASRRVHEIYNIDIKQKDKTGGYSQSDLWWRSGRDFYSADIFDSRTNTLHGLSKFEVGPSFEVLRRVTAKETTWVDPVLGWNMNSVSEYRFREGGTAETKQFRVLPLPLTIEPREFYEVKTDPQSMSFRELRRFMKRQRRSGIRTEGYRADLHEKLASPFLALLVALVALPFALRPARSGTLAVSFLAGLLIAFSYYTVHSLSLALGRAEIWPALLSAWIANILMAVAAVILNLGAEAPN